MNKVTQERVAEKVLKAISDEGLTIRKAGEILGVKPNYLSMIKKDMYFGNIPKQAWDDLHVWVNSGSKIQHYKVPKDHDIMVPDLDGDKSEEESNKDIFADLRKAKYMPPERGTGKQLPPIVQEAMVRKALKDTAGVPLIQDVILNIRVILSIE